jgi:hypothetical protein
MISLVYPHEKKAIVTFPLNRPNLDSSCGKKIAHWRRLIHVALEPEALDVYTTTSSDKFTIAFIKDEEPPSL